MTQQKSFISKQQVFSPPSASEPHTANDPTHLKTKVNINIVSPPSPMYPIPAPSSSHKILMRKRKKSNLPLREKRIQAGYTLEDLGKLTKLSSSYLSRLESGARRLNADILEKLSLYLDCHPGDLLPNSSHHHKMHRNSNNPYSGERIYALQKDFPCYKVVSLDESTYGLSAPLNWIARPTELYGVNGAFAFLIGEHDFGPQFAKHHYIFAHPTRPLSPGCLVMTIMHDDHVIVGEFKEWKKSDTDLSELFMMLQIYEAEHDNKIKLLSIPQKQVKATYRIIGSTEAA